MFTDVLQYLRMCSQPQHVSQHAGLLLPSVIHQTLVEDQLGTGRILIIGDIHGCRDEFLELLDKADFQQGRDTLILAGDLVDKGPYSELASRFTYKLMPSWSYICMLIVMETFDRMLVGHLGKIIEIWYFTDIFYLHDSSSQCTSHPSALSMNVIVISSFLLSFPD